ncbi:TonB-dependent receptor domain-containing protein [Pseudomonas sp. LRF_L74]|uniref:TonB-dependent receptor domain-containing protein n=1 Tax=Pseudomonas sp. LRF_L74 TaxID=3369422 RepID=UPI003F5F595E
MPHPFAIRFKRTALAMLLGAPLAALPGMVQAQQAESSQQHYQIPAGPLEQALLSIARQSGRTISFAPELGSVHSTAVDGTYSTQQAIDQALQGTGLAVRVSKDGVFIIVPAPAAVAAPPANAAQGDIPTLDVVVSTGVRGRSARTVTSSPTPIDVIRGDQLSAGGIGLKEALDKAIPSLYIRSSHRNNNDSVMKPTGLRGLSAGHVLVLINGKRRHNSSLYQRTAEDETGVNPVDLDLIPTSSIDRIEVLRDGAAAQYGSDAIAGVVNIILKSNDHGGELVSSLGQYYAGDGETYKQTWNQGFSLPNEGFVNLALDARKNARTDRSISATDQFYARLPDGSLDPRESDNRHRAYGGSPESKGINASYNAELPINDALQLYSFSTISKREPTVWHNYRRPNSVNNIPEVYSNGFVPKYSFEEIDYQALFGGRGTLGEWDWDLSSSYAYSRTKHNVDETLNASLGPSSPTSFWLYTWKNKEWTNNLDFSRTFELDGLSKPLQFAWGLQHRYEKYQIDAGDPLSYAIGDYVFSSGPLAGRPAAPGAQGTYQVGGAEAADARSRNNYSAYFDIGLNPTDKWFVGFAGRHERFDDSAGNVTIGKLSSRYELTPTLAIRGNFGNGFKAPSLSQSIATDSTCTLGRINGVSSQVCSQRVGVYTALGQALGAQPLKPERSTDFSLGLTYEPAANLRFTLDAYRIALRDRIASTGYLGGSAVSQILSNAGLPDYYQIKYFANALDTRTHGIDAVSEYLQDAGAWGQVRWNLAYNWNETDITKIHDTPAVLQATGLTLFDRQKQGYLTESQPKSKLILGVNWKYRQIGVDLKLTRYSSIKELENNPLYDASYGAKWLTDLTLSWQALDNLTLELGANNLFDVKPDANGFPGGNPQGLPPYGYVSPFGFNGGYYFTNLKFTY